MSKTAIFFVCSACVWAVVFGSVRGVVHDPDHRPVSEAKVVLKSTTSDYAQILKTDPDGTFETASLPAGEYRATVTHEGFNTVSTDVVVTSGSAPVLHFQFSVGPVHESVTVQEEALTASEDVMTPTTIISRAEIQQTPGADLSNSLNMITAYVPGAWVTHDQLHVRGGHQVSWLIDGVPIPNTNIASNVGPQIDPKDIDYLQVQRGGYAASQGDRTYGVFDIVPRTGFERSREGEFTSTYGSFNQTNDQVSFGDHTEKLAYFASLNGNRSDYGLETPGPEVAHDRVWGLGGMASLIYNAGVDNQFRLVSTLRRDDFQIPFDVTAPGLHDEELERDAVVSMSCVHTFSPGVLLTTSPFYHFNRANYDGDPDDLPVANTQHRDSQYAGAQIALAAVTAKHNAELGVYGFHQSDDEFVGITDGTTSIALDNPKSGHLEAAFAGDSYKPFSWLTLSAGLRLTHFSGETNENAADPRAGGSVRLPRLHWVLRGFWGRYYQAPPLSTVSGPLAAYALQQGLGFIPLRGERDEEHQFGLTVPLRGWSLDLNNYHQRARNYFDHNNIGNSDVFFPLTIDHARLYGWEVSVRSPRLFHRGEVYVTYAYAHAEGAGAVSGGLTDFSPPNQGYFLLDHDQRQTFHTGFNFALPYRSTLSGSLYYGSGFPDREAHTTFDLSLGKALTENLTLSATALNLTNRRFLLDDSVTFGGTHYAEPRRIYAQLRYRFHL